MDAKSLSLLKELLPRLRRVGVPWEAASAYNRVARGQFERDAQSLGLEAVFVEPAAGEFGKAFTQLVQERVQALVLPNSALVKDHDIEIIDAAMKHRLPTMCQDDMLVRKLGALLSYSPTQAEQDRVRAEFIDQILRGARPADLPVRRPTKFVLAINLKTAKALGITVPHSLLVQANEVIQ